MSKNPEFLFAHWAVPALGNLRGSLWHKLAMHVAALPEVHPDALAFALMMIELNGCARCDAKRYRERGGCAECACATLKSPYKIDEDALIIRYHSAQKSVAESLVPQ